MRSVFFDSPVVEDPELQIRTIKELSMGRNSTSQEVGHSEAAPGPAPGQSGHADRA